MKTNWWVLFACLAIFHTPPNGRELRIDVRHIAAVRPAEDVKQHLTTGVHSIIYVTTNNFGVVETVEQAQEAIRNCVDGNGTGGDE